MSESDQRRFLRTHLLWCLLLVLFALTTQAKALSPDIEMLRAEVLQMRKEMSNRTPLPEPLRDVLMTSCAYNNIPMSLGLGLIEVESGFNQRAVSKSGCYGLTQLNPRYFPGDLTPAQNIMAGMDYLGSLMERYGDTAAALTAYHDGHDTGRRGYANKVLRATERWEEVLSR